MARLRQNGGQRSEIERLRSRLAEAEETLDAIRRGEVDAIAVEGPNGRQIYTLQTPDRPYQAFAEGMSEGAASLAIDGTILFCNRALAEMLGQAQEKLVGMPAGNLIVPEEKQRFQQLLALAREKVARAEIEFQRQDGNTLPVLISLKPIPSEQSPGICLIATDLSERKRAERELRDSEEQYRSVVSAMAEAVVVQDASGKIVASNEPAARILRTPSSSLQGRTSHDFASIHEDGSPFEVESYPPMVALRTGRPQTDVCMGLLRGDGAVTWILMNSEPLFHRGEATPHGVVTTFSDVTERKSTEAAVLAERQRFEGVLDSLPVMICLLTADYRVAFANRAFEKQFGQAKGRRCYEYCFGKTAPCTFCESFDVLKTNSPHDWEVAVSGRTIHAFDFPFTDADGSPLVLEMDVDITEQRQTEEKLRQASLYGRGLLEASLDPLVTISKEGKIMDANRATELATGLARDQLIGSDFCNYFTNPEKARQGYEKVFAEGEVRDYPLAIRDQSGRVMEVLYNASVFRGEKGEVEGVFAAARDVTDRKRAEQSMRDQAALLDLAHDAIIFRGLDHRILFWNRGAKDLYGWSAEEVLGKIGHELLQTDFPGTLEELYAVLHRTREWEGELKHFCRDGKRVIVASRWSLLRDEQGSPTAVLEINRDVTARKQAEEALRKASRYTRILIEASLDPLVTISREGKITDVNDATVKVTGVEREHLVGSDFCDYFTEPDKARAGYQRVFAEGAVRDYPLSIRRTDGQVRDVLYNACVYRGEKGDVEGVFAAARDVTDRKQAETELRESEQKFATLADFVPQFVWMCTPDGLNFYFNQRWFDYTGLHPEECYGRNWSTPFHPEDKQAAWNAWNHAVATAEPYRVESRLRAADGTYRWFLMRGMPQLDEAGKIVRWFGTCTDIDDFKKAETEIQHLNRELEDRVERRTAELQATNQELEAFSYSVSHDLRAPLRHISGFSKILSEEFGPQLPEEAQHHLDRIQQGTRRMGQLVDDLLNLSRVGRRELQRQVTSLENVVRQVLSDLQPECEGREVQWKIDPLPFADCDGALLKQVFQNLLSNALKFTRPRKQAVIEIGCKEEEGVPVIFVCDNGVGFSMKYAGKLFGVFQRMHRSEDFEGTGVGLATVQRIVQKHGGRVWAEAEVDKGATFYFTLAPVDKTQQESAPQEEVVHELVEH